MALTVSANPRYFQTAAGVITPLVGYYDNWSPQSNGNWADVLATIDASNLNCARLWVRHHEQATPYSYTKSGATYDLDAPNPDYLTALRSACEDLDALGAYAIVMLWQGWSLIDNGWGNKFLTCPYRLEMNSDSVDGDWNNDDGNGLEVDEVINAANANEVAIRAKQQVWIQAVIDELNDLDNIIWEVSNEDRFSTANQAWQEWVADEIRTYEATLAKQHPVGISSTYDGTTSINPWLKSTTADWIAPSHHTGTYDTAPEVNTGWVSVADTDHIWGSLTTLTKDWVWRTVLRGHQPLLLSARTMESGVAGACGSALSYLNRLTLAYATPSSTVASTGYCQAWAGHEYLIYQPGTGNFTATLVAGYYSIEWFNTTTGAVASTGTLTATSGTNTLTPPFTGPAVVLLALSAPQGTPTLTVA